MATRHIPTTSDTSMARSQETIAKLPAEENTILVWLLWAVPILIALGLSTVHARGSLYSDEWHAYESVTRPDFWSHLISPSMSHPPLYFLLAKLSHDVIQQPWAIRIPSIISAMGFVVMFPIALGRIFSLQAQRLAIWTAATAPFLFEFASEGRPYAMVMFLSLAYIYVLWLFVQNESWSRLISLSAITILGLLTHHFFVLLIAGAGLSYLAIRRRITSFSAAYLGLLVCCGVAVAPLMISHASHLAGETANWIPASENFRAINFLARLPMALTFGYSTFYLPALDYGRNVGIDALRNNIPLAVLAVAWMLAALFAAFSAFGRWPTQMKLLVGCTAVPILLSVVAGQLGVFLVREKYLAIIFPATLLLTTISLHRLSTSRAGKLFAVTYSSVVIISLCHFAFWPNIYTRRSNWEGVSRSIKAQLHPGDQVVYYHFREGHDPLKLNADPAAVDIGDVVSKNRSISSLAREMHQTSATIFLIDDEAMRNGIDPKGEFQSELQRFRTGNVTYFGRNLRLIAFPKSLPMDPPK